MNILGAAATIFTTKAELKAAVRAYDANPTDAIATYGAIAGWDSAAPSAPCTHRARQSFSACSKHPLTPTQREHGQWRGVSEPRVCTDGGVGAWLGEAAGCRAAAAAARGARLRRA